MAESTAIFNSSAAFAYLFSVLLLGDKFTLFGRKTLAVIVSFAGVLIIAIGAHSGGGASSESQRLVGDIYVFLAAALYALYEVLYSVFGLPEPEPSLDEDYDAVLEEGSGSLHNDYDSISQSVGGDEASSPPTFQVYVLYLQCRQVIGEHSRVLSLPFSSLLPSFQPSLNSHATRH